MPSPKANAALEAKQNKRRQAALVALDKFLAEAVTDASLTTRLMRISAATDVNFGTLRILVKIHETDPELISLMRGGQLSMDEAHRRAKRVTVRSDSRIDKWEQATGAMTEYLKVWRVRDRYDYSHINPKVAQRRLVKLDALTTELALLREELQRRSHTAKLKLER